LAAGARPLPPPFSNLGEKEPPLLTIRLGLRYSREHFYDATPIEITVLVRLYSIPTMSAALALPRMDDY
jgi:hypothetical protein